VQGSPVCYCRISTARPANNLWRVGFSGLCAASPWSARQHDANRYGWQTRPPAPRQETASRRYLPPPRAANRTLVWSRRRRFWIGSGVWPVRPRVTSSVIATRSSAHLKRPPLVVVLHSPFVAADYAEQISHGSPSSTTVWMALTLHGSGRSRLQVCWRACVLLACSASVTLRLCPPKTKPWPPPSTAKPC
jgi:hypothetical protein